MNNAPNALTESADSLTRLEPVMDPSSLIRVHRNRSVYRLKVGKGENQLSFSNIGWERFSFHSSAFYSRFSLTGNPNDSLTLWGNEINRGWLQKRIPGLKARNHDFYSILTRKRDKRKRFLPCCSFFSLNVWVVPLDSYVALLTHNGLWLLKPENLGWFFNFCLTYFAGRSRVVFISASNISTPVIFFDLRLLRH